MREMTDCSQSHKPLPRLIAELNRHLKGWGNYFSFGRPRAAYGKINTFVLNRLYRHVGRRSQRPYRPPEGADPHAAVPAHGTALAGSPSDVTACVCLRS